MDKLRDLENILIEMYEEGLVKYSLNDDGEVLWEVTPIIKEAMRLGLDPNEMDLP